MCYHCATNPSIHHHCRCVAAISSLLSHHGVTFTVTSSWFRRCHCDVTFIVALSWCRCCSRIVAVSLLQSHCCGAFAVALSWFCHRCHGVTFIIALSRFCCCRRGVTFASVMVSLLLLWCHLHVGHGFIITIMVSPSHWSWFHCHYHGVAFIVTLSRFHRRHGVAFIVALSWCHCHGFIVAIAVSPSAFEI